MGLVECRINKESSNHQIIREQISRYKKGTVMPKVSIDSEKLEAMKMVGRIKEGKR